MPQYRVPILTWPPDCLYMIWCRPYGIYPDDDVSHLCDALGSKPGVEDHRVLEVFPLHHGSVIL